MTNPTGLAGITPATLTATRDAWHRVAEHVLAAALYAATKEITLAPAPGGFATPAFGPDATVLAVDGAELAVTGRSGTRRAPLTTIGAAAEFAGVTPGMPPQVYPPATPLAPGEPLMIDPAAAALLAGWYALGAEAMRRFAAEVVGDQPSAAILWPEHFDLGITAAAVNYGASPGDGRIPLPYLYAGPHAGPPPGSPEFWNYPFGAARTITEVSTAEQALAFFRDARSRVLAGRQGPRPAAAPGHNKRK
jgi:hypothetical protein